MGFLAIFSTRHLSHMTYDRSVVQFCDRQFEDSLSNWPERRQ